MDIVKQDKDNELKKGNFGKKLLGYSAAAGAALAVAANPAEAKPISYNTTVILNPGPLENEYSIDFNDDGQVDLNFYLFNSTGLFSFSYGSPAYPIRYWSDGIFRSALVAGNSFSDVAGNVDASVLNLNPTSIISSAIFTATGYGLAAIRDFSYGSTFGANAYGPYPYATSYGNFLGTRGFLGARFDIGGSYHFAWVDVEVNADVDQMIIHGWGYEDQAGAPIEAGAVPEPGTLSLLALGAAGLFASRRRKQKPAGKGSQKV